MALLPGALIAAQGFGAAAKIGSDIGQAASLFDKTDKDRLKQLERQVEIGEFLSPEEQQQFFAQIGPAEREAFQRGVGATSAFDMGSGQFVAQQMAQQQATAERRAEAQQKLRTAEAQAREAAEEEVDLLKSAQQDRKRAMTTAILGGVATAAGTAIETADLLQTRRIHEAMQATALAKAEQERQLSSDQTRVLSPWSPWEGEAPGVTSGIMDTSRTLGSTFADAATAGANPYSFGTNNTYSFDTD